jgi:hypothetical protein
MKSCRTQAATHAHQYSSNQLEQSDSANYESSCSIRTAAYVHEQSTVGSQNKAAPTMWQPNIRLTHIQKMLVE